MIDLFSVKLNNEYDFIQAEMPQENGTWLCAETSTQYTKGYSYEVTEGEAKRIEAREDFLIQNAI